jgi:hypothetical protein
MAAFGVLAGASRLEQLLTTLDGLIAERYAFDVFARDSINFGIMVTYRQTWEPLNYQVGDLVSTIPLAPKEVRRYTTKTVTKKTRAVKEVEDNLQTRKAEASDTSRVDAEIVQKAQNKTNFNITAHESIGGEGYDVDSTQNAGGEQAKQSEQTKKDFRESVLKSAQEYKQQHRMEIDTSESQETEETTFHEIQNPNDELAVTYLFYELQRTYKISERIHQLTPVILVANDVPAPDEIGDAWLIAYDWVLRRVILDDSFKAALDYLTKSFEGAEINIRILESNAEAQKAVVDSLNQQIRAQSQILDADQQAVLDAVRGLGSSEQQQGMFDIVKRIFDPIGITGSSDTGAVSAAQAMVDYAKETRDRADREKARLLSQLELAITALQTAVDKLSTSVKEHYDNVAAIDRLRVHVKENILYYMQAIWSHEPPDQRFFRLYNIDVPIVTADTAGLPVNVYSGVDDLWDILQEWYTWSATVPIPDNVSVTTKKLVEVAELDTVLGYKGNYMVFALKENNYITLHMMQDYLELGDELIVRDPDDVANFQELATCLYSRDPDTFRKHQDQIKQMFIDRLSSPRSADDLVIVPTTSLYIEALVGTHPLLEDFKLIHRALDVKKVQAEVPPRRTRKRPACRPSAQGGVRRPRHREEDRDRERRQAGYRYRVDAQPNGSGSHMMPSGLQQADVRLAARALNCNVGVHTKIVIETDTHSLTV